MARPKVKELAMETNERAQFIVEEFGYGIYLHMETGDNAVETDVRIGKMASLHTTSAGKAILAHLPEEQVMRIVDRYGLSKRTENTITDPDALLEELETIRDRGYAYNDGERITGMRAVGVPITDVEDDVVGALSVSGPAHRMKGNWYEKEIPDLLLGTANELELNLTYQ
ncbi:IclR family transcriptional regulator [Natrialbaceae archaeon AArc-T1-2]|nr:IclR family transcriptional regulator [Natrialbaceae archaeon AArc-T1-2]WIV68655.1 IclR family transcriptional regulator [Natrialbaceae archaeon AArc-T1-2]